MFLKIKHQQLDIYELARSFVLENYKVTKNFPSDERFSLTQQIRRASLSVFLNIAEGCSRKSIAERKRYYEMSRGSLVEIDAAFDIAFDLGYCSRDEMLPLMNYGMRCYSILCKMIDK
jgi:four helix bundle protein